MSPASPGGRIGISRDKLVGVLVALACVGVSAVGLRVNDPPEFSYVDGVRNRSVSIDDAELTVGEVRVGTRLVDGASEAETTGMFVVVDATLAVPGPRSVYLNAAKLVTADRTYDRWSSAGLNADPGFRHQVELVFEVDPAQIDDLTLETWAAGVVHGYYQRARIHLGITADNAEQWRRAAEGQQLEPDEFGSTEALP
jgi:hypothetical protein